MIFTLRHRGNHIPVIMQRVRVKMSSVNRFITPTQTETTHLISELIFRAVTEQPFQFGEAAMNRKTEVDSSKCSADLQGSADFFLYNTNDY